eukprot:GHVR01142531.1.p2 GENE.GHVR01142531.1~~GHVR01142531.1.p2  ORF type:complete len:141 (+),score=29.89 GHVR01142531.1:128-550(+)
MDDNINENILYEDAREEVNLSQEDNDDINSIYDTSSVGSNETNNSNKKGVVIPREGYIGCSHYERKCKIIAPCCGEVYWCRHCHNEIKNENEKDALKAHEIDRKKVTRIICQICNTEQDVSCVYKQRLWCVFLTVFLWGV